MYTMYPILYPFESLILAMIAFCANSDTTTVVFCYFIYHNYVCLCLLMGMLVIDNGNESSLRKLQKKLNI
jgi:hypothetical protein